MFEKSRKNYNNGITLIALVVTITIILILSGTSISMITGENGILVKAVQAKTKNELAEYIEQLELFVISKKTENIEFDIKSLFAGRESISYNTQSEEEKNNGNIKTICPQMKEEYVEKLEIRNGKLSLNTQDKNEIKIAQSLGIEVNPYEITKDGELIASSGNLLLIDENGTLRLPERVKTIGEGTFANTESDGRVLKKIIIPSTVEEIKANAFNGNKTIEEIIIQTKDGKGVTKIGNYAFANCSNLQSIDIPDTVTEIGTDTFLMCTSLKDVQLSKNITKISYEMFYGCSSLIEFNIPQNVTSLEAGSFSCCYSLKKITLSTELREIKNSVFASCSKLEQIDIAQNARFIFKDGVLMDSEKSKMYYITDSATQVDVFEIQDGIKELGPYLLRNNKITKVIIPDSVIDISMDFFMSSVENIEINEDNPKYTVIDGGIYSKDKEILYMYFSKNESIKIDEMTKEIGEKAFKFTTAKTINFPNYIEKIDNYAIYNQNTKKVIIGSNTNSISSLAFYATNLEVEIDLSNNYYMSENGIIYNKSKTLLVECTKDLENVNVPESVTEILYHAFSNRTKLKLIKLPQTLEKIGNNAFTNCSSLNEIEIPKSVKVIEECFKGATNLKKIKINNKKGSISGMPWGNMYGERAVIWNE